MAHLQGGWLAAVFYHFRRPTSYAYALLHSIPTWQIEEHRTEDSLSKLIDGDDAVLCQVRARDVLPSHAKAQEGHDVRVTQLVVEQDLFEWMP
jgi:hypothetical protein